MGRTCGSDSFGSICTLRARSRRGSPQPGTSSCRCRSLRGALCEGGFRGYPSNPTLGFFPFLRSRSCTLARRPFLPGLSGGRQRELCTSARQPLRSFPWSRSTLLSFLHTTFALRRGLPLQGPSSGHSMAYRLSSRTTQTASRLASSGIARSSCWSSSSRIKEDMCGERGSSVNVLLCLVLCLLFFCVGPVLFWPRFCTVPFSLCMLRRALRGWCSSCTAPDLSADLLKRGGRSPMWTSGGSV